MHKLLSSLQACACKKVHVVYCICHSNTSVSSTTYNTATCSCCQYNDDKQTPTQAKCHTILQFVFILLREMLHIITDNLYP